ncbi:LPS assembly lipoprotein LptE [Brumicola pallidula]|uniref:LPS-assembly lipoprotein LptE n=1 Tax=Brumicola pallidula DSM 14239 = ACAM 615 TaxID=1121922 RepID=K6ZD55_9ALTE|nr:LPS-assembly lipoprotein [Glaciecola pallidula DSM 14239 = ACAM 615]
MISLLSQVFASPPKWGPIICAMIKKSKLAFIIVIMAFVLQGCGFKLRGSQALPSYLNNVVILSQFDYLPLSRALDKRLPVYQLQSIVGEKTIPPGIEPTTVVVIKLEPEALERRLLSIFASGQVAEYELIYSVSYEVIFPFAEPISAFMTVAREYQDDPDQVLAKSRELELVLDEMRAESADRMIRLLSSQYTQALVSIEARKTREAAKIKVNKP